MRRCQTIVMQMIPKGVLEPTWGRMIECRCSKATFDEQCSRQMIDCQCCKHLGRTCLKSRAQRKFLEQALLSKNVPKRPSHPDSVKRRATSTKTRKPFVVISCASSLLARLPSSEKQKVQKPPTAALIARSAAGHSWDEQTPCLAKDPGTGRAAQARW